MSDDQNASSSSEIIKCLFIDVDSTLVPFEGVDELARRHGPDTFKQIEDLTNQAMHGTVPLAAVYTKRLDIIQPSKKEVYDDLAARYIKELLGGAQEAIGALLKDGWRVALISGGCQQAIEPLAAKLGVERTLAVPWCFDEATGKYTGIVESAPTARNGGKPIAVAALMQQWVAAADNSNNKNKNVFSCMIGDGMSDLEAKTSEAVDAFIAFTGVVARPSIVPKADCATASWNEVPALLQECVAKKKTKA